MIFEIASRPLCQSSVSMRLSCAGALAVSLMSAMGASAQDSSGANAPSQAPAQPSRTPSPKIVIDASSGAVIYEEQATRPWYPASTTKLMSAYVALKAIKTGQITLDTPIVVSPKAVGQPPSKVGLKTGQLLTLENALKILMVKSANDVAIVVAEGVGGSIERFVQMMNNEARGLGMRESHFANPHGLHHAAQVTSARDLALLARSVLRDFPEYAELFSIGEVQLGNRVLKNTNGLMGRYPGIMGMKTGFVCASGFNLVASAQRSGKTVIAVVMGARNGVDRTVKAGQLLDKGFDSSANLGAVTQLASSGYGSAPNVRGEICGRGRMAYLGEDDESPVPKALESDFSFFNFFRTGSMSSGTVLLQRNEAGRMMLVPRYTASTASVFIGADPASTQAPRGSVALLSQMQKKDAALKAKAEKAKAAKEAQIAAKSRDAERKEAKSLAKADTSKAAAADDDEDDDKPAAKKATPQKAKENSGLKPPLKGADKKATPAKADAKKQVADKNAIQKKMPEKKQPINLRGAKEID